MDTLRLRALHTKCLSVCEIAEKLGTTPTVVEAEVAKLGLRPHDTSRFTAEPNEIIAEYNAKKNGNEEDKDVAKYTEKQKEEVYQLFSQGMKPMKISEELGIPYKTVSKWTCTIKKQAALDLIASKKEEPASAATDTDSMVESFGKESTDIIPENADVVKLPEALPTVVFDAILEKRDAVLKMIAAEEQHLKSLYADLAVLDEFICREGENNE